MKYTLIWDLPTRIFHWTLSITLLGLWYTSETDNDLIDMHLLLGYFMLGLIIFRLLWGIVGTTHAKFINFFPSFKGLIGYLRNQDKTAGHNPLGALMVCLFLLLLLMQAVSGLFISDDVFTNGPYFGVLSNDLESIMETIHHNVFDIILVAVFVHIVAVAFYGLVKKHNLVKPMLTGKKPTKDVKGSDGIPHSKLTTFFIVVIITVSFVYWLVVLNAPVVEEYFY